MFAGQLTYRARFQSRAEQDDGYGNTVSVWQDLFTRWCNVRFLRGGEAVMASRLEGRQPVIITVRSCSQTRTITSDMRCIIDGRTYNVRELPRLSQDRAWVEFLAESGVADG